MLRGLVFVLCFLSSGCFSLLVKFLGHRRAFVSLVWAGGRRVGIGFFLAVYELMGGRVMSDEGCNVDDGMGGVCI